MSESSKRILVTRSSMPPLDEYVNEIAPIWESHWLTNMGAKHKEFEAALQSYLGIEGVALFTNGHSALECILEALQLEGEVITTPYTFVSTTHAIVRKGLTPVFADIKDTDYTIDPASVESLITDKTCAIVPVHVYGNMCDVDAIQEIADRHHLKVIYDAAHAFGVRLNGVSSACFGDASMFSFHATKVFNTIEGGAVCFHDPSLKTVLDEWKNFGITGQETCDYIGGNAKMNEFCAAMGICNLRHLDDEIAKRRAVAERYWSHLDNVEGIKVCLPREGVTPNYAYMPVIFGDSYGATRDEVKDALAQKNVFTRKYFYPLTTDFACYKGRFDSSATPVAQYASSHVLTLPMFADLALEDVDMICETILSLGR